MDLWTSVGFFGGSSRTWGWFFFLVSIGIFDGSSKISCLFVCLFSSFLAVCWCFFGGSLDPRWVFLVVLQRFVGFFGGSSDIRCVFSGSLDVFCGVWGHFWPGCLCFAVSVLCHHGALEVALPCPHCPHHFEVPHRPHGDSHRVSIALEMAIVTALGTPLGHLHCHRDARPAFPLSCGTPCRAGSVPLSPP